MTKVLKAQNGRLLHSNNGSKKMLYINPDISINTYPIIQETGEYIVTESGYKIVME